MERVVLAKHGGTPQRDTPIYYGKQFIDQDDIDAVVNVLKSELITCGPKVEEFERLLCEKTGAKYAVAVSNGTAALHAACSVLDLKEGDEVITTPITFASTANVILYFGATPIFADINPTTYNISPGEIKKKITPKTKAVIAVDFTGQAVELDEIQKICNEKNIMLIEDAAHSLGTKYKGKMVGSIADITTFSFHPVKTITGGEGGAVLTNDEEVYKKIMLFRTHGITRNSQLFSNTPDGPWYYEQISLGHNFRLTDFQAALLISQLKKLEMFASRRKEINRLYDQAFSKMPEITIQHNILDSDTTKHLYLISLNLDQISVDRKEIFEALWEENICCNVHYIPVYYFPHYEKLGYKRGICPNAESLYETIISIPLYYSMSNDDVNDVIQGIKKVIKYFNK